MKKFIYNDTENDERDLGRSFPAGEYVEIESEHWEHFFSCTTVADKIDSGVYKASRNGTSTFTSATVGKSYLYSLHTCRFILHNFQHTPSSASDEGVAGMVCHDANYIYVCTATDTWKRDAIATW